MSLSTDASGAVRAGHVRWLICGLLFAATTINYIDRAVLGVLKPSLEQELGWTQVDYGWIVMTFQITYALGYVGAGRLFDHIGVRVGYLLSVSLWSAAAMAHAMARSVPGFCLARAGLGLAEGGNFPAAVKTVAEWFPKEERALATGLFNAGSNIGAVACPLLVPWLAGRWGWQTAFLATGVIGFAWVLAWGLVYRAPQQHAWLSARELAYIQRDPPDPPAHVPWRRLLRYRQTWAFVVGMAASAPVWWFYIYWIPDFLNKQYSLQLTQSSLPLMTIFLVVGIGGMAGAVAGMFSAQLIGRVLHYTHNNYFVPFALASLSYLLALGAMHALVPNLERLEQETV